MTDNTCGRCKHFVPKQEWRKGGAWGYGVFDHDPGQGADDKNITAGPFDLSECHYRPPWAHVEAADQGCSKWSPDVHENAKH